MLRKINVLQKFAFKNQIGNIKGNIYDIALKSNSPLLSCTLLLKSKDDDILAINKKSAIMLSRAIPREYYGGDPAENTYYFPPLNIPMADVQVEFEFEKEKCDVEILIRMSNVLKIADGMARLCT